MTDFIRAEDEAFNTLPDFEYEPKWHHWQDMRMHFVDEGPRDGPVMLLLHGMPTWSYLYRDMIPLLAQAGYRCIAPDHLGFGRSDKPTDVHWYTIARHVEVLTSLITELDLQDITLVCQDWGGPIGLSQPVLMPARFSRIVIMNTWLHHEGFEYSEAIQGWHGNWQKGGLFDIERPNLAALMALSTGHLTPEVALPLVVSGEVPDLSDAGELIYRGFRAPIEGLPDEGYNGFRRFPLSIPLGGSTTGNAAMQAHCYDTLLHWQKPVSFIWGCSDPIFPESWGREWAKRMNAGFDAIPDAGHFLQITHGAEICKHILDTD